MSPLTVWVTNGSILLLCLLNIFIYGEPKVALNSGAARQFWKWKEQAERDYRQVSTRYLPSPAVLHSD